MNASLLEEILTAIVAAAPEIPQIISLGESALGIVRTGTVTPEQEAAIRQQLDAVNAEIQKA